MTVGGIIERDTRRTDCHSSQGLGFRVSVRVRSYLDGGYNSTDLGLRVCACRYFLR